MISILAKKLLQDITKRGSARVSSLSLVPRSENMAAAIRRVNSMQYDVYTEAGKKGGQHSGGNFKNDPQRASEAGKKGGKSSHGKSDN